MNNENPHLRPELEGAQGTSGLWHAEFFCIYFSPQSAAILEKACNYSNMTDTGAQLHLHTFT